MALIETCGGIIKDGLCTKCYSRQTSTSIYCVQVYEVSPVKEIEPKLSPELERALKLMDEAKQAIFDSMRISKENLTP